LLVLHLKERELEKAKGFLYLLEKTRLVGRIERSPRGTGTLPVTIPGREKKKEKILIEERGKETAADKEKEVWLIGGGKKRYEHPGEKRGAPWGIKKR